MQSFFEWHFAVRFYVYTILFLTNMQWGLQMALKPYFLLYLHKTLVFNSRHFSYCTSKCKVYDVVDESYECESSHNEDTCRICRGETESLPASISIRYLWSWSESNDVIISKTSKRISSLTKYYSIKLIVQSRNQVIIFNNYYHEINVILLFVASQYVLYLHILDCFDFVHMYEHHWAL